MRGGFLGSALCLVLWTIGFGLLLGSPAEAHKVNIFAYVEDGILYAESYFPDGKPVEKGKIQIFDSQDQKLTEGLTDKQGLFSIPVPKKDDLTIVIDASMGHKNTFLLKKDELGE